MERVLPRPSFTVQTLSAFHAVRPGIEPHLIIGSDIVSELPRWREPERLAELGQIVVVPRQGAPQIEVPRDLPVRVYDGFRLPKVSSTEIKARLGCGSSVEGLLDRSVLGYIRQKGLYNSDSSHDPYAV